MSQRVALGREVPLDLAERLFAAAFACFSEKGFERTTMDDVAVRAGVARATLYYYFRGKDDLFLFLVGRGVALLSSAMEEATAEGTTARRKLERALDRMVDLFLEYRHVLVVAMQQFGRIQDAEAHDSLHERSTAVLRGLLDEGRADGSLRAVEPGATATAIFGALSWSVLHHLRAGGDVPAATLKEHLRALVVEGLGV